MNLGDLIARLETANPEQVVRHGFHNPHSYRGDYYDLAFEPATDITVADMLEAARSAVGATYQGYKGGDFRMDVHDWCWLSEEGSASGETISALLLDFMLTAPAVSSAVSATTTQLRDRIAETLALRENGPASDGRGWYRNEEQRRDFLASADAVLAVLPPSADQTAEDAYRLALSTALRLGTGANWEAIRDRAEDLVAEVRQLTEASRRLLEQRQEMAEERFAWQERGDQAEERVRALEAGAAALTEAERTMLAYALDQAQEKIWSEDGFTDEDQAAVTSLRRLAAETAEPATQAEAVRSTAVRRKLRRWAYAAGHIESELDGVVDGMYALIAQDITTGSGPSAAVPAVGQTDEASRG